MVHFAKVRKNIGIGFTDEDMIKRFTKPRNVISALRNKLVAEGIFLKTGDVEKSKASGREITVWMFCDNPQPVMTVSPRKKLDMITLITKSSEEASAKVADIKKVLDGKFLYSDLTTIQKRTRK